MFKFFNSKILNGQSRTITSAALVLALASAASRILGLARDRMLAGRFGAGDILDVYYAAFRAPDLIVGPVHIAVPQLDPVTGRALQPRSSEALLALNETQLKIFQTSPLYVGVLLALPGSNGKVIRIAVEDYVDVQALATLRWQVDENTLK